MQDYGGTPTLFGIASVINHLSEMAAYFLIFKVIGKIGHVKVLAFGLLCNVCRFLYISFITWPWLILPFEFVQGIKKCCRQTSNYNEYLHCVLYSRLQAVSTLINCHSDEIICIGDEY